MSRGVHGMQTWYVKLQLVVDTFRCCSGPGSRDALGMEKRYVNMQLALDMWRLSSGQRARAFFKKAWEFVYDSRQEKAMSCGVGVV
jgi:hypothetical protein